MDGANQAATPAVASSSPREVLPRIPSETFGDTFPWPLDPQTKWHEVSATMGVTVGTVKSTVARALAKLRADEQLCADIAPYRDGAVFRVPAPRPDADQDGAAGAIAAASCRRGSCPPSRRRPRPPRRRESHGRESWG